MSKLFKKINIDKEDFIKKVLQGWTIKDLQEYYGCSRSTIILRKKEWNLIGKSPNSKKRDNGDGTKTCITCKKVKSVNDFYSNGRNKLKPNCKKCDRIITINKHNEKIREALYLLNREYKCEKCGYDKNTAALAFHHNKGIKNFEISSRKTRTMLDLKDEIELCEVLCLNCHSIEHSK